MQLGPFILDGWRVRPRGRHLKMALDLTTSLLDDPAVASLSAADLPELEAFYAHAYPDNWFDPRMVDTGAYVGVRDARQLVCVAGVHTVSKELRVAALGNIATSPAHRGRGLARRVTGTLCARLRPTST